GGARGRHRRRSRQRRHARDARGRCRRARLYGPLGRTRDRAGAGNPSRRGAGRSPPAGPRRLGGRARAEGGESHHPPRRRQRPGRGKGRAPGGGRRRGLPQAGLPRRAPRLPRCGRLTPTARTFHFKRSPVLRGPNARKGGRTSKRLVRKPRRRWPVDPFQAHSGRTINNERIESMMRTQKRVAYFCMEYGLDEELPLYAGGLGVLAGDHIKSAGDLHAPLVAIGLYWREGYTIQRIGEDGRPYDTFVEQSHDFLEDAGVRFTVTVRGEEVACRALRCDRYANAPLYLIEPVDERHRWVTRRLYGGGAHDRVAQEILLGVGGVRLLRELEFEPEVYHFNEGHAVFAGIELI